MEGNICSFTQGKPPQNGRIFSDLHKWISGCWSMWTHTMRVGLRRGLGRSRCHWTHTFCGPNPSFSTLSLPGSTLPLPIPFPLGASTILSGTSDKRRRVPSFLQVLRQHTSLPAARSNFNDYHYAVSTDIMLVPPAQGAHGIGLSLALCYLCSVVSCSGGSLSGIKKYRNTTS